MKIKSAFEEKSKVTRYGGIDFEIIWKEKIAFDGQHYYSLFLCKLDGTYKGYKFLMKYRRLGNFPWMTDILARFPEAQIIEISTGKLVLFHRLDEMLECTENIKEEMRKVEKEE